MTDHALTPALEDYLETIYRLVAKAGFARVRDIASARDVRPGSVTPAMKRLDQLGLIDYQQREYVGLTPAGEVAARKIYARHQVLRRFFRNFLSLPEDVAERDACNAEHTLSPETVDALVRLFEYMEVCPEGKAYADRFKTCSLVNGDVPPCPRECTAVRLGPMSAERRSVADLQPGQQARIVQIESQGAVRQRLLDMGILPHTMLEVARVGSGGDPVWIRLQGYELALRRSEAGAVLVTTE
jgi:DtxR family Mn-dependent transcriptional regulator